jgi:hypothetical protein
MKIKIRGAVTEHPWTAATIDRVAMGLLKIATDFGLLSDNKARIFTPHRIPDKCFEYLLNRMFDKYLHPRKIIYAADWRIFLLSPFDVEKEILFLSNAGKLSYKNMDNVFSSYFSTSIHN